MPLAKQLVPMDFTQGTDTKTDEKLGIKPTFMANAVFSEKKTATRRPGHVLVQDEAALGLGSDAILASLRAGLVLQDKSKTYAASPTFGALKNVGRSNRFHVTKRRVVRRTTLQMNADHASVSGLVMYAWQDSDGTTTSLKYSIYEEATGAYLLPETTLTTTGWAPKVVAFSDRLAVIYGDGANLKMTYVTVAAPTAATTVTMQTNYINTTAGLLDAAVTSGSAVAVVYTATADIRTFIANSAGSVTVAAVTIADTVDSSLRIGVFSGGNILVLWGSTGSADTRKLVYSSALAVVSAAAQFHVSVTTYIALIQDAANQFTIFIANNSGAAVLRNAIVNSSGTITTAMATFLQYAVPASDPFVLSGRLIIPILTKFTNEQPTIILVERQSDGTKKVLGALLRSTADGLFLPAGGRGERLASVRTRTTTTGTWPILLLGEKGKLEFRSTQDVTRVGISEFMLEPDLAGFDVERNRLAPVEYGRSLYFPGPQLMQFDGVASYEFGFNLYPEFTTPPAQIAGSGIANGTYQYAVTYEFVDAQGQLHRSAPCVPASVTISGGPDDVAMSIRTLPFTDKQVNIVVWRTLDGGTVFHRVNPVTSPILNSLTAAAVNYTDSSSDSTISAQEILYTTAELESVAPPASSYAHVHQRRLLLVQAENRNRLSVSDELTDGYGPTFNEATEIDCGPECGDVIATGSLDEKILLLRRTGLQFISGEGPNRAGLQNTFTAPQFITSDTGCVSAASVVQTPDGVMFKGERGMYLMDRSLRLVWLGQDVESLTGRIACSVLLPKKSQVRFSCPDGTFPAVLVYDYAAQQWSTFTDLAFDGMTVVDGTLYALTRSGAVWSESASAPGDVSTPFFCSIITPWIKTAGVQGFQRVWRAFLLGSILGESTITLNVGYDYEHTLVDEIEFLSTAVGSLDGGVLQVRTHLVRQKCTAVRFLISCDGTTALGAASLGAAFTNMTLECGVKRGGRKLPASKTVG